MLDKTAEKLKAALDPKRGDVTVADAAVQSGLSLADAERALHQLVAEYRGHLRVTEEGQILFRFPHGFSKPWETVSALNAFGRRVANGALGLARFVVRAWVAIVLVGYVAIFIAIMIALAFTRSSDNRESRSGGSFGFGYVMLRLLSEAFFWTFHPFSPFYGGGYAHDRDDVQGAWGRSYGRREEPKAPFYERVDRFFFGPKEAPPDPDAAKRSVLAQIRVGKGRIGLADVMRVTGQPRDAVDPLMSQLMLDYEGKVEVSEDGGIVYLFPDVRKTAAAELPAEKPRAIWEKKAKLPPVTGNAIESDLLIGGLNAFNLIASLWAIAQGLTIERLIAMLSRLPPVKWPAPELPIALGVVPLVFSIALFALPLVRLAFRPLREKKVARENGRRAVLQAVLENAKSGGVSEETLKNKYRIASGLEPDDKEITKQVLALGGDVDLDKAEKGVRYRFLDLELEAKAVEAEREAAGEDEAKVGKVVFSSED